MCGSIGKRQDASLGNLTGAGSVQEANLAEARITGLRISHFGRSWLGGTVAIIRTYL